MANLRLKAPPILQAGISILAMWLMSRYGPMLPFTVVFRTPITVLLMCGGALIGLAGIVAFRQARTTVDPRTPDQARTLVIVGIYKHTRNPMYLGLVLILFGSAVSFGTLPAFLVIPVFIGSMTYLQIKPEEVALEKLFGDHYRAYQQQVRRWL